MFIKSKTLISFIILFVFSLKVIGFTTPSAAVTSINVEQSSYFGLVVTPHYANLLSPNNALGFEIALGAREFRLASTYANAMSCNQLLKITVEYLAQQILFDFRSGASLVWDGQYAGGIAYQYLFNQLISGDVAIYQTHSRDDCLPAIYQLEDDIAILYRDLKGANSRGVNVGLTLKPLSVTQVNLVMYFDAISYGHRELPSHDRQGLGAGIKLIQILHPRLKMAADLSKRILFDQYQLAVTWLLPVCCDCLELSLSGLYRQGDIPQQNETRYGLMLTYAFNPAQKNNLITETLDSVVRMPQVFVVRDQLIVP